MAYSPLHTDNTCMLNQACMCKGNSLGIAVGWRSRQLLKMYDQLYSKSHHIYLFSTSMLLPPSLLYVSRLSMASINVSMSCENGRKLGNPHNNGVAMTAFELRTPAKHWATTPPSFKPLNYTSVYQTFMVKIIGFNAWMYPIVPENPFYPLTVV